MTTVLVTAGTEMSARFVDVNFQDGKLTADLDGDAEITAHYGPNLFSEAAVHVDEKGRPYYERDASDGDATCADCAMTWAPENLANIEQLWSRLDLSSEELAMSPDVALAHFRDRRPDAWPLGQCPDCGALCYAA